ncbi:MAG: hypothetical protein HRT44_06205 [Bdellovibrionales bacterium]|nr:hypothetical protein [Bdellovibrionales bacterium]
MMNRYMKKLVILLSFIPQLAFADLVEPQVINTSTAQRVVLGASVTAALESRDPDFVMMESRHFIPEVIGLFEGYANELPQALAADYNNDRLKDIIVMGFSKDATTNRLVIRAYAVISRAQNYQVIKIDQWNVTQAKRGADVSFALAHVNNTEMYLVSPEEGEVMNSNLPQGRKAFKIEILGTGYAAHLGFIKDGAIHAIHRALSN